MRTQKQLQTGSGVVQSFPSLKRTVRSRTRLQVSAESRTVSVTFRIHRPVKYGLMVTITGGSPALSSWGAGIPMNWSEGHNWIATVDLPVGSKCEYKYVVRDTKTVQAAPEWQPGDNMAFTPPEQASECEVQDSWDGRSRSFNITKPYTAPPPPPLSNVVPAPNSITSSVQATITAGAPSTSTIMTQGAQQQQQQQQQTATEQPSWMVRSVGPVPTAASTSTSVASSSQVSQAAPTLDGHTWGPSHHYTHHGGGGGGHDGKAHGSVDDIHLIEKASPVLSDAHAPPPPEAVSSKVSIDLPDDEPTTELFKDIEEASRQAIPSLNNVTNPPSLSRLNSYNTLQSEEFMASADVAKKHGWPGSNGHAAHRVNGNAAATQSNGCGSSVDVNEEVHRAFEAGDSVVFEAKEGRTRADVHAGYTPRHAAATAPASNNTIMTSSSGSKGLELAVRVIRAPRMRRVLLTPSGTAQSQLELLTVHELRNECKKRGMACSGSREDLLKRLRDAGLEW